LGVGGWGFGGWGFGSWVMGLGSRVGESTRQEIDARARDGRFAWSLARGRWIKSKLQGGSETGRGEGEERGREGEGRTCARSSTRASWAACSSESMRDTSSAAGDVSPINPSDSYSGIGMGGEGSVFRIVGAEGMLRSRASAGKKVSRARSHVM
jgi:hypothetical protein